MAGRTDAFDDLRVELVVTLLSDAAGTLHESPAGDFRCRRFRLLRPELNLDARPAVRIHEKRFDHGESCRRRCFPGNTVIDVERVRHAGYRVDNGHAGAPFRAIFFAPYAALAVAIDAAG